MGVEVVLNQGDALGPGVDDLGEVTKGQRAVDGGASSFRPHENLPATLQRHRDHEGADASLAHVFAILPRGKSRCDGGMVNRSQLMSRNTSAEPSPNFIQPRNTETAAT